jgi:hypothetical protein
MNILQNAYEAASAIAPLLTAAGAVAAGIACIAIVGRVDAAASEAQLLREEVERLRRDRQPGPQMETK